VIGAFLIVGHCLAWNHQRFSTYKQTLCFNYRLFWACYRSLWEGIVCGKPWSRQRRQVCRESCQYWTLCSLCRKWCALSQPAASLWCLLINCSSGLFVLLFHSMNLLLDVVVQWRSLDVFSGVCLFVCVFVYCLSTQHNNFRTSKCRMIKLEGRCIVQKSRTS